LLILISSDALKNAIIISSTFLLFNIWSKKVLKHNFINVLKSDSISYIKAQGKFKSRNFERSLLVDPKDYITFVSNFVIKPNILTLIKKRSIFLIF